MDIAKGLDVAARIGHRIPHETLAAELGSQAADRIRDCYTLTCMQVAVLVRMAEEVDRIATREGFPVIVLKGMAQHLVGITPPGSRPCGDIDLLVDPDVVDPLTDSLIGLGFVRCGDFERQHHHETVLRWNLGAILEVHTKMPYASLDGGAPVTAGDVFRSGLAETAAGNGPNMYVPAEDLRVAHLLVHGVVQHAAQPGMYPFGRVVADVVDLGWDRRRRAEFLADGGYHWIHRQISRSEVEAVFELADALRRDDVPDPSTDPPSPTATMLRHLVASSFDADYRRSINGNLLLTCKPEGLKTAVSFLHLAGRRWFITRQRFERRTGHTYSWWRYALFVATRPPRLIWTVLQITFRTIRYRLARRVFSPTSS